MLSILVNSAICENNNCRHCLIDHKHKPVARVPIDVWLAESLRSNYRASNWIVRDFISTIQNVLPNISRVLGTATLSQAPSYRSTATAWRERFRKREINKCLSIVLLLLLLFQFPFALKWSTGRLNNVCDVVVRAACIWWNWHTFPFVLTTTIYNVPLTDTQFHKNIVDSSVQSLCASLFNLIVKCIQSHSFKPTNEWIRMNGWMNRIELCKPWTVTRVCISLL